MSHYIEANWNAPKSIRALTTTIRSGHSIGPYASNNLALHVEDNPEHVLANRAHLKSALSLPGEPAWLMQTHSTNVVIIEEDNNRTVDASITRLKSTPLVILTADCLPILICDNNASEIAAIHAGWRGLYHGVIQNTLDKMQTPVETRMAWIGPAICHQCYEVSTEIKAQFIEKYPYIADTFVHRHANLASMAERILQQHGVTQIYHSNLCTFEEKNQCYSYRRAAQTGRMGTLIWFEPSEHS